VERSRECCDLKMEAWVTLATNDSYSVGALTLAASLNRVKTTRKKVCMVTDGISSKVLNCLHEKFDHVVNVEKLDSGDVANLKLLERSELGITFTKLHCWTLTQFSKCVFLDADTLVLANSDELFEREEFSAARDAGWPDYFNSGVFVFRPSLATFTAIVEHAKETGSFDGGDQGLLNTYFSDWAFKDISKHLPFIYNLVSTATYSYKPAYVKNAHQVKIVHFIGATKPWLMQFNNLGEPQIGVHESHTRSHLQLWWQIYTHEVSPSLSNSGNGYQSFPSSGGPICSSYTSCPPPPLPPAPPTPKDKQSDWEKGSPDYTGTASFNNILKKIDETLTKK